MVSIYCSILQKYYNYLSIYFSNINNVNVIIFPCVMYMDSQLGCFILQDRQPSSESINVLIHFQIIIAIQY
jgi:hypothetical protein